MTSVRQTHVSTMSSSNHDNNLDALLEELQTSVSRPGSSLGHNGPVTGYREVTRTVTTETAGRPVEKTSEYHIEYLNPSNTTTVMQETYREPRDLAVMHDIQPGRNVGSYKTVQYQYNTTSSGTSHQDASLPVADARMRQNITELDSLLDDLHTAQKTGFSDSSITRHTTGIDPGLLEPIDASTPKTSHISRSVDRRTVQEQHYGSVGQGRASPARDRDVRRELLFTGSGRRDQPSPSPIPGSAPVAHKEVYRYESKTTRSGSANSRDLSPPQDRRQPSPSPARQLASVRTYNYSSADEVPRTPTMHRSPSPSGVRSSSSTTVRQYNYSNRDFSPEGVRQPPLRSPSPSTKTRNYSYNTPPEPPRNSSKITSVNSYSYNSSSRDTRTQEVPRSPPPHRSPSPVSFTSPPLPTSKSTSVKTYNFDQSSSPPYVRPQSPQPAQKFSPSDPSRTLTYQVSPPPAQPSQPTVITYKYSSQTTHSTKYPGEENAPLLPRPFPTPSPTPETQQQPPKKLDELMASFSDTDVQHHQETSTRYMPVREPPVQRTEAPPPPAPVLAPAPPPTAAPSPASTAAAMQVKSKNIAGPPVYYPPGVELFAKKEETMMQSQSGGGKYKAKAKYEYESSSKMKSKESSGKTVVPVCLPVCCAMPCVIM